MDSISTVSMMNITDSFTNTSNNTAYEEPPDYTLSAQLSTAISWLETAFIVSLNTVVIRLIVKENTKKSRMFFFLLHLTFADLCVGLLDVLPIAVERTVGLVFNTTDAFLLGSVMCKLDRMVAKITLLGSNLILSAMSIDRAIAVTYPLLRYGKGHLLQKTTIVISWTTAIFIAIPDAILSDINFYDGDGNVTPHCSIKFDGTTEEIVFKWKVRFWTDYLFIFLLPATMIVISYTILLVIIFRRGILRGRRKANSASEETNPSDYPPVFDTRLPRSKMRSIKLTLGIVLGFIVCWTPYFFWNLLQLYRIVGRHPAITVCMTLRYLNSVTNPIMFFIFHRKKLGSQRNSPVTSSKENDVTTSFFQSFRNKLSIRNQYTRR